MAIPYHSLSKGILMRFILSQRTKGIDKGIIRVQRNEIEKWAGFDPSRSDLWLERVDDKELRDRILNNSMQNGRR